MIHYIKGDVTAPVVLEGHRFVAHVCNNIGWWGRGVSGPIGDRWPTAKIDFLRIPPSQNAAGLGRVVYTTVQDVTVCGMIAQNNVRSASNPVPLKLPALDACLAALADNVTACQRAWTVTPNPPLRCTIHMPRIGCGLAGGSWEYIEPLIARNLTAFDVYVYDFQP